MNIYIKRAIAGVLSAVLFIGLINLPALSLSLASELSGYAITVEYSDDNTSALLAGDTSEVREDVQLNKLVDSQGQELDPAALFQEVRENGTYNFTLYYYEIAGAQDGDQSTTEEKTQELEVVVNGIGKPKADQPQQPEVQEGIVMGGEAEKDGPPPFAEKDESMTAAPRTVPLDLLQRSTAQTKASKTVHIYANEAEFKLKEVDFSGGSLVAGAAGLPTVDGRTFVSADYIVNGTNVVRAINGLYSYNDKWYYTVNTNTVNGGDAGTMYIGFELPANVTVRLHYKVTNEQKYQLDATGTNADLATGYKMYLNGKQNYSYLMYPQGTKIVLNFVMPVTLSGLTINISNVGNYNITSAKKLGNGTLTENQIWETSIQNYTLVFTMPAKAVKITFNGTQWTNADTRNFAIGSDFQPESGETFGDTRFNDYSNTKGSFFRSIPYDQYNSPGIVNDASVTHVDGGMEYSPRTSFQVYNQGSSTGVKTMLFAQGSYKSNQMVGFELRMDRRTAEYTWKANSLVMNVYVGVPYTWSTTNYRQYTIKLAHTDRLSVGSTEDTYLDCGARVRTVCWQWTADAYYYKIFVYDMTHNFTLYDRPAKTNNQNFVIGTMDGISTTERGTSLNTGTDSYISEGGPYAGGARALHENDDFQATQLKMNQNRYETNFYIRPLYGYTAPQHSTTSFATSTYISRIGAITGDNLYQYTLIIPKPWDDTQKEPTYKDGPTKGPATISFTSKPITFAVKYYYQGNQYHDAAVSLTASGNTSSYAILNKLPSGLSKLKGYQLKVYNSSGGEIAVIPNSNSDNQLWYPDRDIVNFKTVYDYLMQQWKTPSDPNCVLRIVPVAAGTGEGSVQAQIQIKEQSKFAELDNDSSNNRNLTTTGENANATSIQKNLNAYVGTSVSIYGNKKQYEKGTKKYLYNEAASRPVGTVTAENPIVASLEYVLATTATMKTGTLGTGNNYNSWKSNIEGKWFTSIGNFNHIINISALNPGTKDGMIFDGWQISAGGSTFKVNENTMVWNDNGTKYLSLAKIGRQESDLWTKIFDNGTFTLEATWRSNVAKVTTANGTTIVDQTGTAVEILEGQKTMVMSATFRYANTSVTQQELQNLADTNQLRVALVKKNPSGTGGWQVRSFDNSQTTGFSRPSITVLSNGDFRISFTFTQMSGGQEVELDPVYNDGANFRIFAWTSANTGTEGLTADTICSKLNAAEAAASEGNAYVNPYQDIAPSVMIPISMLYKVRSSNGTIGNMPGTNVEIYQGATSFKIVGTFQYGDGSATLDEIQTLYNNGAADGKLRVALIKQNPAGGNWSQRVYGSTATNGFTGPVFTAEGNTFKVEFTVSGTNNGAIDPQWNDGANFRIYVWTAANVNGADVSATTICNELNGSASTTHNQNIPSVSVMSTMLYKVTDENGSIGSVADEDVLVNDGGSLTVEAQFRYGDGTADEANLQTLFADGELHIALLKVDPEIWTQTWRVLSSDDIVSGPAITKEVGALDFKVSFQVSNAVGAWFDDGAQFRIYVWTDANGTKENGVSIEARDIANTLNKTADTEQPNITGIPWQHFNISLLYKVVADGEPTSNVTLLSTSTNIPLSAIFKYNFDIGRYPNGYNGGRLMDLITNGDISATLEYKKSGEESWTSVTLEVGALTVMDAAKGLIRFDYSFTPEDGDLSAFDGAEFKIKVQSKANDTPAEHTVMVTYVSDPTAYVNIPKYIILDDNNSNVTVGDVKQDGYAGKLVEVTYNDATMEGDFKPDIEVKVQDGVKMKEGSISGAEVSDMAIGIYNTSGLKLNEDTTDTGYCSVGTLSATNLSLPFWMNVKRSTVKDQQYYATVTFILKLSGITT